MLVRQHETTYNIITFKIKVFQFNLVKKIDFPKFA